MKLARLRRRLSYANVIATMALFFSLTGASMAGVKYLMPTDAIPASSDLTGTYGSPQIAAGKVSSAKIADGAITSSKFDGSALAPNADKLDGLDSTGFLGINAKAADADKLDGNDSSAFLGASAKAADADKLDGMDSQAFAQGVIEVFRNEAVALPNGPLGLIPGADVIQHELGPGSYLVLYKGQVQLPANGGAVNCAATGGPAGPDVVTVDAYHAGTTPWHSPIVMTTTFVVAPDTTAQFKINCVGAPGTSILGSRLEILRVGVSS